MRYATQETANTFNRVHWYVDILAVHTISNVDSR
jgi:hypothetical protein